jgi:hypothetical protein
MSSITFIVNTPVVRVLTFKEFKAMEETKEFSEEKLNSVWAKMVAAATNGEIVAEAATGVHECEDDAFAEVNDLVDTTISDATDEVKADKEEAEEAKAEADEEVEKAAEEIVELWLDDLTFDIKEVGDLRKEEAEFPGTMEGVYESATGKKLPRRFTNEEFSYMATLVMGFFP